MFESWWGSEPADPSAAARERGNVAFKSGNYKEAIDQYTEGLQLTETAVLYSNRSAAFACLRQYEQALSDAEMAIRLDPKWPKGYSRKGKALYAMGRFKASSNAFSQGLEQSFKVHGVDGAKHEQDINIIKRQSDAQAEEYLRMVDENAALRRKIEDLESVFGDYGKKTK